MSKLYKSRCFTVEWKIVNFSHLESEKGLFSLKGHFFKTETKSCRKWWSTYLTQSVTRNYQENEIHFVLRDNTGESSELKCEVFLLSTNGEIKIPFDQFSKKGIFEYTIKKVELFGNPTLLSKDTLTVLFKFFGKEIIHDERCMFQTVLHRVDFLWQANEFKFTDYYVKRNLHEQDSLQVLMFIVNDHKRDIHEVRLETQPNKQGFPTIVIADLSIKDDHGQCIRRKKFHNCSTEEWDFEIYEKSDTVRSLQFELKSLVAFGMECPTSSTRDPQLDSVSTTAEANLQLFRKKLNSDATLKAGGISFPVHQNILSSRSPVFRKMFEPHHPRLDIPDVDSKTLERLLVYLYGDTLEDVQWEQAMALYRAANSYAVPSLKSRCADILKEGLTVNNACDLVVLAGQHADDDLMRCTVDFIRDHREVVSSEKWSKVEASNLQLAAKITRELYLKKEGK